MKNKNFYKNIPNIISVLRIMLSIALFFLTSYKYWFLSLYLICGFTDVLDGFLARRLNATSNFGAKLDTLGDIFMYSLVLFTVFKVTDFLHLNMSVYILLICIVIIRIINFISIKLKFNQFAITHTLLNKFSGLLLFICPLLLLFIDSHSLILIIGCSIALVASIDELLIILIYKKYDINKKCILLK